MALAHTVSDKVEADYRLARDIGALTEARRQAITAAGIAPMGARTALATQGTNLEDLFIVGTTNFYESTFNGSTWSAATPSSRRSAQRSSESRATQ